MEELDRLPRKFRRLADRVESSALIMVDTNEKIKHTDWAGGDDSVGR